MTSLRPSHAAAGSSAPAGLRANDRFRFAGPFCTDLEMLVLVFVPLSCSSLCLAPISSPCAVFSCELSTRDERSPSLRENCSICSMTTVRDLHTHTQTQRLHEIRLKLLRDVSSVTCSTWSETWRWSPHRSPRPSVSSDAGSALHDLSSSPGWTSCDTC